MRSGHAATAITPVLFAGVGVRDATGYAIRLATFRLEPSELGRAVLGIVSPHAAASATIARLLSGRLAPAYGELQVLGHDLRTQKGRAAVRSKVGLATRTTRVWPTVTVRRHVEQAVRRSTSPCADRRLLVAAILDRMDLMPWADVQLRAAPGLVGRRARLAAACVHEPSLLIIDGLFDRLGVRDRAILAGVVTEFARDISVVAIERDADSLLLFCDQVIVLADGILLGRGSPTTASPTTASPTAASPTAAVHQIGQVPPLDHAR